MLDTTAESHAGETATPARPAEPTATAQALKQAALVKVFGEKFARDFTSAYVVLPQQPLHTPTTNRFFWKDFAYLSRQMHYEYQYRTWYGYNTEILDRFASVISTKLSKLKEANTNYINRLEKILQSNGYGQDDTAAIFPRMQIVDVPLIAPQARAYLDVLHQVDRIYILAGSAYLWGVLDAHQRAQQEWFCKKAVRAFRALLQGEVIKLYREASRMQAEQRGAAAGDAQMSNLVAQQGDDIKAFAKDADDDSKADAAAGRTMPSDDPAAVIDEVARASKALSDKKTNRAKKDPGPAANEAGANAAAGQPATTVAAG